MGQRNFPNCNADLILVNRNRYGNEQEEAWTTIQIHKFLTNSSGTSRAETACQSSSLRRNDPTLVPTGQPTNSWIFLGWVWSKCEVSQILILQLVRAGECQLIVLLIPEWHLPLWIVIWAVQIHCSHSPQLEQQWVSFSHVIGV